MTIIAYSSERQHHNAVQVGTAHYSYLFIENAFVRFLERAGYVTRYIREPQIYKSQRAFQLAFGCNPQDIIHIAFRSTENIRPMKGARNICHYAWEFDVMKSTGTITESVLENQVQMLSMMDEIWVGCSYSKAVLEKHGINRTYVVPAPVVSEQCPPRLTIIEALNHIATVPTIPLCLLGGVSREENAATVSSLMRALSDNPLVKAKLSGEAGRIFLSIVNPNDLRKNLLNLIEGFQMATNAAAGNNLLIVKLIIPSKGDFRTHALFDHLGPRLYDLATYIDKNIMFIVDYLSDLQMAALFSIADYYLSPSHSEGFNRPLTEAMSYGAVPVSTANTAMLDYVDDLNSIVISDRKFASPIKGMAGDVAGKPYGISYASRFDIARACSVAISQSLDRWNEMSRQSRKTVLSKYGDRAIRALFEDRVSSLLKHRVD